MFFSTTSIVSLLLFRPNLSSFIINSQSRRAKSTSLNDQKPECGCLTCVSRRRRQQSTERGESDNWHWSHIETRWRLWLFSLAEASQDSIGEHRGRTVEYCWEIFLWHFTCEMRLGSGKNAIEKEFKEKTVSALKELRKLLSKLCQRVVNARSPLTIDIIFYDVSPRPQSELWKSSRFFALS